MTIKLDALDSALLSELAADPRTPILELASRLKVARNTVQARMKRLEESGLVRGYPPNINLSQLGFAVHALVFIETDQTKMNAIIEALQDVPMCWRSTPRRGGPICSPASPLRRRKNCSASSSGCTGSTVSSTPKPCSRWRHPSNTDRCLWCST